MPPAKMVICFPKPRYISLEKLYERLEIINQYNRFYNLKKRIIEPSINDINTSTTLSVEWDVVKKGKMITGLVFKFKEKQTINSLPTEMLEEETL